MKLNPSTSDTIRPFVLAMEVSTDYQLNKTHVEFVFSEQVTFNDGYLMELAQLFFRRKADICSSTVSDYFYESQYAAFSVKSNSIKFGHHYQDCDSCYSGYGNYYQETCLAWGLESVNLLPWLCQDETGNFLTEFQYLSK